MPVAVKTLFLITMSIKYLYTHTHTQTHTHTHTDTHAPFAAPKATVSLQPWHWASITGRPPGSFRVWRSWKCWARNNKASMGAKLTKPQWDHPRVRVDWKYEETIILALSTNK